MQHAAISRPKPLIVAHLLLLMAEQNDGRYHRAAAKWAGRLISEQQLSLEDSHRVLALVDVMATAPHAVVAHLRAYL